MIEILVGLGGTLLAMLSVVITLWTKLRNSKHKEKKAYDALNAIHRVQEVQNTIIKKQQDDTKLYAKNITSRIYFGK